MHFDLWRCPAPGPMLRSESRCFNLIDRAPVPDGTSLPTMIALQTLGRVDLRVEGEGRIPAVLAQPKRLALLIYLVVAGASGPVRRDSLLALFWPNHDSEHGRGALRQALRFLRRELHAEAVLSIGDDALIIPHDAVQCDALNFRRARTAGNAQATLDFYAGDFLSGFFVPETAPEFDDWVEAERQGLRAEALDSARQLMAFERDRGQLAAAVQWAKRATAIAPDDEVAQRELMMLFAQSGDRIAALRSYEDFKTSLLRQLGISPSKETVALTESIRRQAAIGRAEPRTGEARNRVAILTFVNMTARPEQEFLCEAYTQELVAVLSKLEGIRIVSVTGRYGLAGRMPDLQRMREEIDIDFVLDGTIWRGGEGARVSAVLVDANSGTQRWADSYEVEWTRVIAAQGSIARKIAGGVHLALTGTAPALPSRPTRDIEAYNLYLKGRFWWGNRVASPLRALEFLNDAVAADPDFALAYAAIADAYNTAGSWETSTLPPWECVPKAEAAARRALEIDPHLAEAHAALGYINVHFRYEFDLAERQLCTALSINPNYQHALHWYSHLAMAQRRADESLHWSLRALQADPLDAVISIHLAWHYWFAGRYEAMLEQCNRTAELDATGTLKPLFSGFAHVERGEAAAAIEAHREAVEHAHGSGIAVGALGYTYAAVGEKRLARVILKRLHELAGDRGMFGYECAIIRGALGDTDAAFEELHRAYRERSSWIPYLDVDPRLARLRSDHRFERLRVAVGAAHRVASASHG